MPGPGFIEKYLPAFAALVAQANDPRHPVSVGHIRLE